MAAHKIFIRTQKQDSAFIHHVIEAHEGWAFCSTLPFQPHDPFRDLVLIVPDDFVIPVKELLESLCSRISILNSDPSTG